MVRKNRRITDPAYEIINLLRSRGYKAKLFPPDDTSLDDSKAEEILAKIKSDHPDKKSPK